MSISQSKSLNLRNDSPGVEDTPNFQKLSSCDSAPPNGGLRAWLQVLGSFFLFFNTWYVLASITKRVISWILLISNVEQGNHQLVRSLPNLLRTEPPPRNQCLYYFLDWLFAIISYYVPGCPNWAPLRCRPLDAITIHWIIPCCVWPHDA